MNWPPEHYGVRIVDGNANMLVPWVLMASYAYYQLSRPIVSDATYDAWCLRLHRVWHRVKHRHKELIIHGETTCRVILGEGGYPGMVTGAVSHFLEPTDEDTRRADRVRRRQRRTARRRRADD